MGDSCPFSKGYSINLHINSHFLTFFNYIFSTTRAAVPERENKVGVLDYCYISFQRGSISPISGIVRFELG